VRIDDPEPNRLLLVTASSPVVPSYYIEIDARLVSVTRPGPTAVRVLNAPELALAGDDGALVLTFIWGVALAAVSAVGTYAALRWSPWAAYLAAVPVALAVLWNLYQSLAALLPNVY
jgi:sortase A